MTPDSRQGNFPPSPLPYNALALSFTKWVFLDLPGVYDLSLHPGHSLHALCRFVQASQRLNGFSQHSSESLRYFLAGYNK